MEITNPSDFFKQNNYIIIENFMTEHMAHICYEYVKNKTIWADYIKFVHKEEY